MSWNLYLDDIRNPEDKKYTIARSVKEAKKLIQKKGFPSHMSLDHDLGEGETGYDFVKWIVKEYTNKSLPSFTFQVHSSNPVGKENMEKFLENFIQFKKKQVEEAFLLMKRELTEAVSKEVYHFTHNPLDVLKINKFNLHSAISSTDTDKFNPKKKYYDFSVSRIKFSGYARSKTYGGTLNSILVLDGEKLNHNYHGKAVDYWGREYRTSEVGDKERRMKYDENEERIFTDKPFIAPASKYIKEIHIYFSEDKMDEKEFYDTTRKVREIAKLAKVKGIPTYIHDELSSFKLLKKDKRVEERKVFEKEERFLDMAESKKLHRNFNYEKEIVDSVDSMDEALKNDSVKMLINSLNTNLKNMSRNYKELEDRFISLMKKYKTRDMKEFVYKVLKQAK